MDNPADYCSRHPLATTETSRAKKMEKSISMDEIERETLQDTELQQVTEAIHTGIWHKLLTNLTPADSPFRVYHKIENELCTMPDCDATNDACQSHQFGS